MPDTSVTSPLPISKWDPALQSVVRCLEAIEKNCKDSSRCHTGYERDGYQGLIFAAEMLLLIKEQKNSWVKNALADLVASNADFIPTERASEYLYAAALSDYAPAQYELACRAKLGQIYPPDDSPLGKQRVISRWELDDFNSEEAVRWMENAAQNGSLDAQYTLGMEKITSDNPREFRQGAHWISLAAFHKTPQEDAVYELDHYNKAKYVLAYQMELGRIEALPLGEMFRLYEDAAKSDYPEAMLAAGHYLEYGIGVKCDVKKAAEWYAKAGDWGRDEGYLFAGLLSDDYRYLKKAANGGHVAAMLRLAPLKLDEGCEASQNLWARFDDAREMFQEGMDWYQCASAHGSLEATLALAEIYEDGWNGQLPDEWKDQCNDADRREDALACYERARELGWEWAAENIERIEKKIDRVHDDPNESRP